MNRKWDLSKFIDTLTEDAVIDQVVEKFIKRRKELKITQKRLSELTNVSYASIRRFESTGEISFTSLLKLANAIDCLNDFTKVFDHKRLTDLKEYYYNGK